MRVLVVAALALAGGLIDAPALAQDTRAELLAARRAERAKAVRPYEPPAIERGLLFVEEHRVLERLAAGFRGFYPRLGGFTTGSGFGFGAGYRTTRPGERPGVDLSGAVSTKGYKAADLTVRSGPLGVRWLEVDGAARWHDFPQEDFFGLGSASARGNRTSYRYEATDLSAGVTLRPVAWLSGGHRWGTLRPTIAAGTDPRFPSIEERFTAGEAPGLAAAPDLLYTTLFVDVDYRDEPGNTRGGGRYRVEYTVFRDGEGPFDVDRFEAELLQVFPIFDKKRNFAVRVLVSEAEPQRAGSLVPFFLMPTLGGSETLRGFREFRFRDATAVLVNGEYRWEAFSGLDLALFFDAGDVAPAWDKLALNGLKTSWGVGFRFNTNRSVFLRLDIGTGGSEGTRFFFKFGPAF